MNGQLTGDDMNEEKRQIQVTSLEQLNDRITVNLIIDRPGGVELVIPLREIDWQDYLQVEFDYPLPKPDKIGADRNARPIYDTASDKYIKATNDVLEKRDYARLLMALQIDIPGETEEEQMAALAKMPATVIRTMRTALNQMHSISESRVEGRANGFQQNGDSDTTTT